MMALTLRRGFSAAHRVASDPGLCSNLHGHNYEVEIEVIGKPDPHTGFIVPFDAVKHVIDRYDHAVLLDEADELVDVLAPFDLRTVLLPGPPTTEALAVALARDIGDAAGLDAHVRVAVRENPSILATAEWPPAWR